MIQFDQSKDNNIYDDQIKDTFKKIFEYLENLNRLNFWW